MTVCVAAICENGKDTVVATDGAITLGGISPYDMSMSEFKKEGRDIFGDEIVKDMSKRMDDAVTNYLSDELLVVGWGKSPLAAMLYQRSAAMSASHALTGSAAIGSGYQVALSTLMLLGQSRYSPLEQTVYNVAAAKFMAEKSEKDGVGRATGMFIAHKRTPDDDPSRPAGNRIQASDIKMIRALWEQHGRPRTVMEAMFPIEEILRNSGLKDFHLSTGTKMKIIASGISVPGNKMSF